MTRALSPPAPLNIRGLCRSEVARKTGLSLSHVSRILSGQRTPSLGALVRIADYLGVTTDELIGELAELQDGR